MKPDDIGKRIAVERIKTRKLANAGYDFASALDELLPDGPLKDRALGHIRVMILLADRTILNPPPVVTPVLKGKGGGN